MNYAELIATSIVKVTGSPDAMLPVFKQIVLDSAVSSGFKLEETDLLDEIPPKEAEAKLKALLRNKAQVLALLNALQPAGTPDLAAQGAMLSQIEKAKSAPPRLPAKPAKWSPLRMFKRGKG